MSQRPQQRRSAGTVWPVLLLVQVTSLVVAALGALLGELLETRPDGHLTGAGAVSAVLIVIGLAVNGTTLVLREREQRRSETRAAATLRKSEEDQRRQERRLITLQTELLQQKPVRSISVAVTWSPSTNGEPAACAVLCVLWCERGRYAFALPNLQAREEGTFRAGVARLEAGARPIPATIVAVDELATVATIGRDEVASDDWLVDVATAVREIRYYVTAPLRTGSVNEGSLRRALASVDSLTIAFDRLPSHILHPARVLSAQLVLTQGIGGPFLSTANYSQALFYAGSPDWPALAAAEDRNEGARAAAASDALAGRLAGLGATGDVTVTTVKSETRISRGR